MACMLSSACLDLRWCSVEFFALAIVKNGLIANRAQSSKVEAALQALFPGVSSILVVEDDSIPAYRRSRRLSESAETAASKVTTSSRISAN